MNYLTMKDGSIVNSERVVAIRLRGALPDIDLGPAVIVDYINGGQGNSIINECSGADEQAALMDKYRMAVILD